jgi:hypothetical protein
MCIDLGESQMRKFLEIMSMKVMCKSCRNDSGEHNMSAWMKLAPPNCILKIVAVVNFCVFYYRVKEKH